MSVKQIVAVFVAAAATVVARPMSLAHARRGDVSLSDWHSHNLESYWTFRNRYRSFNCASQKGTDFYETCCYPLAANEHASSLPVTCKAADDATCDVLSPTRTAPALSTPTVGTEDNGNSQSEDDENDDDLPWCDDEDDGNYDDGNNEDGDYQDQNQNPSQDQNQNQDQDQNQDQNQQDPNEDARHSHYPPSPAPTSNPGDEGDVVSGGWATWYEQEGLAGACGEFHSDDEFIAAMDYRRYGNIDSVSKLCGKRVHITNTRNGKTVEVVIRDVCPTCKNENSIDLSLAAFQVLDEMEVGMLPIDWYFMN